MGWGSGYTPPQSNNLPRLSIDGKHRVRCFGVDMRFTDSGTQIITVKWNVIGETPESFCIGEECHQEFWLNEKGDDIFKGFVYRINKDLLDLPSKEACVDALVKELQGIEAEINQKRNGDYINVYVNKVYEKSPLANVANDANMVKQPQAQVAHLTEDDIPF